MLASGKVNCGKCSSTVYFAALFASKGKPESPVRPTTIVQWPESPSTAFPEAARVSPRFIAAHAEAERAHRLGLVELAGMGYRRALEVLVKDDAISRFPGSRETIEREALGSCIANRIDDPLVREAAKRLTWLGNDWAHYVRSWTQYDVDHMKTMLGMVAQFLMMRASLERLPEEMPAGKKPREAS
ncbi:MAG: DUF4145 domain-containing protein [Xanthomonadales bacterium]|nr:DUF4145 domain-containing protein [Myxococcales bacterium]MCB1633497.1 DUF4145 domain-containing protein [Xanthomonadales bacterium]